MAERDNIWKVVLTKNVEGGTKQQEFTNSYYVRNPVENANDASFDDVVAALKSFEADVFLENTNFVTAAVTAAMGINGNQSKTDIRALAGAGTRTITTDATAKVLPLNTVAYWTRRAGGRAGKCEFRNAITDTAWKNTGGVVSVEGAYFDDPDASGTACLLALAANGTPMVLWTRKNPDFYRTVVTAGFSYVIHYRDTTSRRSGREQRVTPPAELVRIFRKAEELIVEFGVRYAMNVVLGGALPPGPAIRALLAPAKAALDTVQANYPALPE